ncbi:DUF4142 domain-containing protein [Kaistella flava (ex Peng et al. 2021)]|uniref:DUF4142 domain-containing protein n=1 Tax=Kaistella flava (ex Peng et al. 2021) TaxID=2038776 RepID=A0A7M2YAD2_9FLAO|nr:DUF4142 domain-containing protein [Kaistella flava (ex Peng et al. 2021)]QOW10779.1 DUF4142 domain-containing protein [Kaistella flava (ex Peng et al. 2021)]
MKNSILTVLAITALVACKKTETTAVDTSADSTNMMAPTDSGMMTDDTTKMSASTENVNSMSDQDKKFAENAAKGGMMEVMLGNIAETNSSNETVKAFGKLMVADHTKADNELKDWASKIGYILPDAMDADQQKTVDDLKMKKGVDFDKPYTDLMVNGHKSVIADFKKEISGGTEPSLKSFASATLPTLEHHLVKAEEAKKSVK